MSRVKEDKGDGINRGQHEEDFGLIRPSLIKQLRSILDQYPDDGQILKELLQNAEDAEANEVKFLYDQHSYGTDPQKLYHADLAEYQGPALYAYNNGLFQEKDWTGIRMLQESVKEKDPMKVGRFGLGFKSVLHMTDLPSVLSTDRLVVIDPHERFFKYQGNNTTGYSWKLRDREKELQQIPHQCQPFMGLFGSSKETFNKGYFQGTLFRFPFRTKASTLADTVYNEEKMEILYKSFEADAHLVLIFLHNVEKVELCTRKANEKDPVVEFKVQIAPECLQSVRQHRQVFRKKIQVGKWMEQPVDATYGLQIECIKFENGNIKDKSVHRYLVCEYFAGGEASIHLKTLQQDPALSYVPLVGVAMPIEDTRPPSIDHEGAKQREIKKLYNKTISEENNEEDNSPNGHVFCFLPLPVEQKSSTGFPVHVNGYFSVSQNRRHLKWPVAGQKVVSDKALLWNQCLLQELIPKAYTRLLLWAIELSSGLSKSPISIKPQDIYAAIPNLIEVDEKWKLALEPLFKKLFQHKIFYSKGNNGSWLHVSRCVFDCIQENRKAKELLAKVLLTAGIDVVEIPMHILFALGAFSTESPETITPLLTRNAIKRSPHSYQHLEKEDKLMLLKYILKDEDFRDLDKIELLPLANDTFLYFTKPGWGVDIYLPNEEHPRCLLPSQEHLLLKDGLDEAFQKKFKAMANEGFTQLRELDKVSTAMLLQQLIPKRWYESEVMQWLPNNQEAWEPPVEWLEKFWNYLRRHYPGDLNRFVGLPVLPINKEEIPKLTRLALPSKVILASALGCNLSQGVKKILNICGVIITEALPDHVQAHGAVMGNYVRVPFPEDTVDAIFEATKPKGGLIRKLLETINSETSVEDKREMRELCAKCNKLSLSEQQKNLLRMMPLFETVKSKTDTNLEPHFVSLSQCDKAAPPDMPSMPTSEMMIDISAENSKELARTLGARTLTRAEFLGRSVLPGIVSGKVPADEIQDVMQYVIQYLPHLLKEDSNFLMSLQQLPFVSARNGRLVKPSSLFDPENSQLQEFFMGEDKFPTGMYCEKDNLAFLRKLGLRYDKEIQSYEILQSVSIVEQKVKEKEEFEHGCKKALAIWKHINSHSETLYNAVEGKTLCEWLKNMTWLPTLQERPPYFPGSLPWPNEPAIGIPRDMVGHEWCLAVGSLQKVALNSASREVAVAFGWVQEPSLEKGVEQLKLVSEHYTPKEKGTYLGVILSIYDVLGRSNIMQLQDMLLSKGLEKWVWTGDGFTTVGQMALEKNIIDLRPYIHSLPPELLMYKELFLQCGAQPCCNETVLVDALFCIWRQYENLPSCAQPLVDEDAWDNEDEEHERKEEENTASVDVEHDMQLIIAVLNVLKGRLHSTPQYLKNRVLIPVQQNEKTIVMKPIEKCTYCDSDWLRQGFDLMDFSDDDGIHFIHPDLPTSTAEALGVPTLMSRMLVAEELNITGFGQAEPLTVRLKNLLDEYTDGLAIPKELIQNADDAGATEVFFMYDERRNENCNKYLIDEGMKECHGPALWAYNNAQFTDEDFKNITKLGGGTKEKDLDKIGKFGLGFNAVYNITDVPSFVSRNSIVIFDPHTTHLGKGIKDRTKPGIRINMDRNKTLLTKLPDQFKPYNDIFGCKINPQEDCHFDGTLFRLPLRTRQQAARSDICDRHYDHKEMQQLLQIMTKGASSLLLFTQNVCRVKFYHLPPEAKDPSEAVEIFTLEKEAVKVLRDLPYTLDPESLAASEPKHVQSLIQNSSILKACKNHYNLKNSTFARMMMKEDTPPTCSMVVKISYDLSEEGGKLSNTEARKIEQPWMISSMVSGGHAKVMAGRYPSENFLPVAGVAVPLLEEEDGYGVTSLGNEGGVFCYLPLPIKTGFPVHINGLFATHSNRKYLTEQTMDDKGSVKAKWNKALMEDTVCSAYIQLLKDLGEILAKKDCTLCSLWPTIEGSVKACHPLVRSFYQSIVAMSDFPVALKNQRMFTLGNCVFISTELVNDKTVNRAMTEAFVQYSPECHAVDLSAAVKNSFQDAGLEEYMHQKMYNESRFFAEIYFHYVAEFEPETRVVLLLYALQSSRFSLLQLISDHPCIPVTPSGEELKKPCDLVHPGSTLAKLYSEDDGKFPNGKRLQTDRILSVLKGLGMRSDELSWADMIDRARSIGELNEESPSAAKNRLFCYLDLLNKKIPMNFKMTKEDKSLDTVREVLANVAFLPILAKPVDFPLPWMGESHDKHTLMAARDLQLKERRYLASSTKVFVDDEFLKSKNLIEFLHLDNRGITLAHVITQLEHAIQIPIETLETKECGGVLGQLEMTCNAIYGYLKKECADQETMQIIRNALAGKKWILIGNKFHEPSAIALSIESDCAPYLYALPNDMKKQYGSFFRLMGVREEFEVVDYVRSLQTVSKKSNQEKLDEQELHLSVKLVQECSKSMDKSKVGIKEVEEKYGTLYVPNTMGIMMPSTKLCHNDCPWFKDETNTSTFTHPHLSYQTASSLGVKTRKEQALKKHAKGIAFGQREQLTKSLDRILQAYPCNKEILKELVQNADDAQATEIHFIKDYRYHPKKYLFGEAWEQLQGPALCVYNNKQFTQSDIAGIQKLGEGSKVEDPSKTGQYGIGFSSMYHLTDVPSFMTTVPDSGQTLCIFDPNCGYVPGASPAEPGMQYDDVETLKKTFPDVFSCYLEESFDLSKGTMFRFPLRSYEMASKSEIKKTATSMNHVETILSQFREEAFELLLFTNCLQKICISEVRQEDSGEIVNTYTITSNMSEKSRKKKNHFIAAVKDSSEQLKKGDCQSIKVAEANYDIVIKDSYANMEKWFVCQRIGMDPKTEIPQSISEAFYNKDLALLPQGGVAVLLDRKENLRSASSIRPNKAFCLLPLPIETTLPVNIDGRFALGYENRQHLRTANEHSSYRNDWNDLLCLEVIAPCYLRLLEGLRMQWLYTDVTDDTAIINGTKEMLDMGLMRYQKCFPSFNANDKEWEQLVRAVYHKMAELDIGLFPSVQRLWQQQKPQDMIQWKIMWLPACGVGNRKGFFSKFEDMEEMNKPKKGTMSVMSKFGSSLKGLFGASKHEEKSDGQILKEVLLESGFKILDVKKSIVDNFRNAEVQIDYMSPEGVVVFLKSYSSDSPSCTIGKLPCPLSETAFKDLARYTIVLNYCKRAKNFVERLEGLPLLLTYDLYLRVFTSENPVFHQNTFQEMISMCPQKFMHSELLEALPIAEESTPEVFQTFDIQAMVDTLPQRLPEEFWCHGKPIDRSHPSVSKIMDSFISQLWNHIQLEIEKDKKKSPQESEQSARGHKFSSIPCPVLDNFSLDTETLNVNEHVDLPSDGSHEVAQLVGSNDEEMTHSLDDSGSEEVNNPPIVKTKSPTEKLQEKLKAIENWCLIPARTGSKKFLVPVKLSETVVYLERQDFANKRLHDLIRKLCLPELDVGVVDRSKHNYNSPSNVPLIGKLTASLDQPMLVLKMLYEIYGDAARKFTIYEYESSILLNYFGKDECVKALKEEEEYAQEMLCSLPIFTTICGDVISVQGCLVYVLPAKMPTNDIDIWQSKSGTVFLRKEDTSEGLYTFLSFAAISIVDVYCQFILQHFEYFTHNAKEVHLKHLYDNYIKNKTGNITQEEQDSILETLKDLHFIEDVDGELLPASSFYDPEVPLFGVMYAQDKFPSRWGRSFSDSEWLDFLRRVGLQTKSTLTKEKYLEFAKMIECEAQVPNSASALTKSKALMDHFNNRNQHDFTAIVTEIADIKFLPPHKVHREFSELFPQHGDVGNDSMPYIAFKESISCRYENLVWTRANLLPIWAYGDQVQRALKSIGIANEPKITIVVSHLKTLCENFQARNESTRTMVFKSIYEYLHKNLDSMEVDQDEEDMKSRLEDFPFVLLDGGTQLVKATQTVVHITDGGQILPYLFRLPRSLGHLAELFRKLGATQVATVDQYAGVLNSLQKSCKYNQLTPNELLIAFRAMKYLFQTLQESPESGVKSSCIYMPSEKGVLLDSSTLVFNDAPSYYERLKKCGVQFLVNLKECGYRHDNYEELLQNLPLEVQPSLLSSVGKETLIDTVKRTMETTGLAAQLEDRLHSKEFEEAILRLMRHHCHKGGTKIEEEEMYNLVCRIPRIKVFSVRNVVTHLMYNGKPIQGSEIEKTCVAERIGDYGDLSWRVYIKKNASLSQDLLIPLAEIINTILKGFLHDSVLYLLPILTCEGKDITKKLNELNVRFDHRISSTQAPTLPVLGTQVTENHQKVLKRGESNLDVGEYVAFKEDQELSYVYAIIREELQCELETKMFLIDVGGGKDATLASLSQLYKFRR